MFALNENLYLFGNNKAYGNIQKIKHKTRMYIDSSNYNMQLVKNQMFSTTSDFLQK